LADSRALPLPDVPPHLFGALELTAGAAKKLSFFGRRIRFSRMRRTFLFVTPAFLAYAAFAQPSFDVASIKPVAAGASKADFWAERVILSPGGLNIRNGTIRDALVTAYSVKDFQVAGPDMVTSARFDIAAKAEGGAGDSQLKLMLQTLLAERFHLALHRETRELPVYELVLGKKAPHLEKSNGPGACDVRAVMGKMSFQSCSMAQFINFISKLHAIDRPVIDATGLEGFYDFSAMIAESRPEGTVEAKQSAEKAFQDGTMGMVIAQQVGFRLEPRKAPVETLVVDHVERPTEN
jgi:uncharacterized protein (TIGR03435 family)